MSLVSKVGYIYAWFLCYESVFNTRYYDSIPTRWRGVTLSIRYSSCFVNSAVLSLNIWIRFRYFRHHKSINNFERCMKLSGNFDGQYKLFSSIVSFKINLDLITKHSEPDYRRYPWLLLKDNRQNGRLKSWLIEFMRI